MRAVVMVLFLVGCAESTTYYPDAGHTDAQEIVDAADHSDVRAVRDGGGLRDGGDGFEDASDPTEAGDAPPADPDSGTRPVDAGRPVTVDAAPSPDAAVPVISQRTTGSLCLLDTTGRFWCWGRWSPAESARLMGTDFDDASGSCALRGREVWCVYFGMEEMRPVMEGAAVLQVDTVAEYSDLGRGCGTRSTSPGWWEVVCWRGAGSVEREGAESDIPLLVSISAAEPGRVSVIPAVAGREAYDINPPATCISTGVRVECTRDTGGSANLERPSGDHYVLGFHLSCSHQPGRTVCAGPRAGDTTDDIVFPDDGTFRDHAIAWPIDDRPSICISGDRTRCYNQYGEIIYTVRF